MAKKMTAAEKKAFAKRMQAAKRKKAAAKKATPKRAAKRTAKKAAPKRAAKRTAKKAAPKRAAKKGVTVKGVHVVVVKKGARKPKKGCKSVKVSKAKRVMVCPV